MPAVDEKSFAAQAIALIALYESWDREWMGGLTEERRAVFELCWQLFANCSLDKGDAAVRLRTAFPDTASRHHFIEAQQQTIADLSHGTKVEPDRLTCLKNALSILAPPAPASWSAV